MFNVEYGMRANKKKVLILITDGKENFPPPDQVETEVPLQQIKEKG